MKDTYKNYYTIELRLSHRQLIILHKIINKILNKDKPTLYSVGKDLNISTNSVKTPLKNLFSKFPSIDNQTNDFIKTNKEKKEHRFDKKIENDMQKTLF